MEGSTARITMVLIGPGVLCVFGIAFLWAWAIERRRHYLLLLAAAPVLFAFGVMVQVLQRPPGMVENALISALFYTTAVLLLAEGVLRRSGKSFGMTAGLAMLAAIMAGLWYFAVIVPDVLVRIYIQNFGYGAILLFAALRLGALRYGKWADRVLFWVMLVFAVQFFLRTVLTIGLRTPDSTEAFAASIFWAALHLSLAVLGAAFATAILAAALSDIIEDLRRERDVDTLTGVLNRRGFEGRARAFLAQGSGEPHSLILCDLDHFKQINDRYGHAAGDRVLNGFGGLLRHNARADDLFGRIGGEEFAILLRDTALSEAIGFAERLRLELSALEFPFLPSGGRVTASFGVAAAEPGDSLEQLLARADRRLYLAKTSGRNRTLALEVLDVASGR
ncbi:GGDEF domain-containing protein [Nitratireductor sp. GCM10026969]|uniref:GGDEF domain-containing protein n=1 Tax=Nitratireductor sp. GCM10026969 TaxID=3252645 RepID=UPI003622971D